MLFNNLKIQIPRVMWAVIRDRNYTIFLFIVWLVLFGLMFYLPVRTVPGNTLAFQAVIFGFKDYLFLGVASFLSAFIITIQVKIFRQRRSDRTMVGNAALGSAGFLSGIVSSVFGTATCSLCVAALFGFLGANSVIFLVNNKIYVVFGSLALLGLSTFLSLKKLNNSCDVCK